MLLSVGGRGLGAGLGAIARTLGTGLGAGGRSSAARNRAARASTARRARTLPVGSSSRGARSWPAARRVALDGCTSTTPRTSGTRRAALTAAAAPPDTPTR